MPADAAARPRQPLWFLLLLALAVAGGSVAYVPFLTILLPLRITELTGTSDVAALSYATFAGAIIASLANIGFGWLSDRSGRRRGWIVAGLALSGGMLLAIGQADATGHVIALIMIWQLGLNMMLGPLFAWAGDCVPDEQKGLLGGLFAFAPALGAMSGALVTIPGLADAQERLLIVVALVAAMVLPAVLLGKGRAMPHLMIFVDTAQDRPADRLKSRTAITQMWIARLLVQMAEAALFAFLLFWLRSIVPDFSESRAARIFSLVLLIAVPVALVAGRWSDRRGRPMLPLVVCAALSSVGLFGMALSTGITSALMAYVLFGIASMVFLALHSGQTLRVLPRPQHRGRDMGIFNLTNTLPSIIVPGLTLSLIPVFGFDALFLLLAALSAGAFVLMLRIASLASPRR